jgi:predicted MFS family arabinose efflux permease
LLLGLLMGQISDRIGRKRAMLLGVGVAVFSMGMEVTVGSQAWILFFAFLAGAGHTLYFLSQAPFMMKVSTPQNRTLLFSLNFGLVTLAGAVGSLFAGQLPAVFGSLLDVPARSATAYQAVLLVSVALSLLTLIPLALIKEPRTNTDREQSRQPRPSAWNVLKRPLTLKMATPNLLIGFGAAILMPYINLFFSERHAVSDQTLGVFFSISALLTGVGSIIGPRLAGNLGSKIRAVVYTQSASLLFLLLMGFSPLLGVAVFGFLARGVLMNMAVPLYSAYCMEQVAEREQGTVNSVKELAWQVGWAVGPYISGLVQQAYGFTPLFITTAVLYAAAIVFTWLFFAGKDVQLSTEDSLPRVLPGSSVFESPGD